MAMSGIFWDITLNLVIAVFFVAINTPILRMITSKIYNIPDTTFSTASSVIIWVTAIYFILSFLTFLPFFGLISILAAMSALMFLIRRYYNIDWGKTSLVWMVWFGSFVIQGMVVVSVLSLFI